MLKLKIFKRSSNNQKLKNLNFNQNKVNYNQKI